MEFLHNLVQAHNVAISGGLLLLAYIFIATEKIPKVTIALIGAAITVILGLVSQTKVADGALDPHYFVNFIDFNVIFLLVSMMIIVSIAARSGMFNWVANELLKLTKGHPISFMGFLKYGFIVMVIALLISSIFIYFRFLA